MKKFRFLKWKVYKDSKELFQIVIKTVSKLPQNLKYEIGNQLIRSCFSIILNIAEGSGKIPTKN
jgi:four helix bundle protein